MKVMFAVPSFWPSQDGVANITGYLARGLAERGHEILIFTSAGKSGLQVLPESETYQGMRIERMRVEMRWPLKLKGRDEKSCPARYLEQIRKFSPDVLVVVCAQTWTLDWIRPYLDQISCSKVFYSHGYSAWKKSYPYWDKLKHRNIVGAYELYRCRKYYKNLYRDLAKFELALYLSDESNSYLYAEKYGLTNGEILENAIDDVFFEERMQHRFDEESDGIRYLYVANYGENKNQEMLIRAYAQAEIGKSQLILIGFEENDYTEYLHEIMEEETWENGKEVRLLTHLPRQEIIDFYRICDVFTCSSKSETWSIVAHEAAATAMPIISTKVGIYAEMDGVYLVDNEMQMRRAMEELYQSGVERRKRGMAAREWVLNRNCRVKDKVDWLEKRLIALTDTKRRGE